MKYELIVRPEPFSWPTAPRPDRVNKRCTTMVERKEVGGFLSFRPEPFLWPTESEWESEANRTGPDYIRWVQSSLNRVMGLRLAVDGIMGPATRSAVRSFQQRKGLAVDGIVGPNTEAALIAAGAPKPPVAVSASAAGSPSSTALPPECSAAGSANCDVLEDFAFDDDTLTAIHREQIAGIARRVISSQETSAPITSLLIVGHASPEGPVDYNIDLALRRATEVEFALLDRLEEEKRDSTRQITLEVKSCGEATIPGESNPAKQRRVDVCFPLDLRACDPTLPIPIRKPVLRDPIRAPSPSGPIALEQLERITTRIPWPRGLVFVDGWLVVLARGGVGTTGPVKNDLAGHLFGVDIGIAQPYSKDLNRILDEVKNNACRLTEPAGSTSYGSGPVRPNAPFRLWNPNKKEDDIDTDRPYAGLVYDPRSQGLFVACFSGIDVPDQGKKDQCGQPDRIFKKNGTDAIHRFHVSSRTWHRFEAHDPTVIPDRVRRKGNTGIPCPPGQLKCRSDLPNKFYFPSLEDHAKRAKNTPPPHGWLNGPDGLCVFGNWLYAVGKDNHVLVRYDLTEIRRNPQMAGPPRGTLLFQGSPEDDFDSPSAVNVQGEYLYVGIRADKKNAVLRFRLRPDGNLRRPGPGVSPKGEVVARFPGEPLPDKPDCIIEPDVIDIAFNHRGELFVSGARAQTVWRVGKPTGDGKVFTKKDAYIAELPKRCSNIAFDQEDRLYICCNSRDDPDPTALPGVIYRAPNLT